MPRKLPMHELRSRSGFLLRCALAILAVSMGIVLTITPPPGTPGKPTTAYLATAQALSAKLPECNWSDTALGIALNEIERGSRVSIRYDLDALRADGIDPATLVVTARLRDIRACKALEVLLEEAGPSRDNRLRHFIADDGTVVITTSRGDAKRAVTRVYNVSDVTVEAPRTPREESQLNQEITRLVTQTVDPESWTQAGGSVGSIRIENGLMTVRQTPENLRLISNLLGQLSEAPERLFRQLQEDAR
jgi:hypothetical protein